MATGMRERLERRILDLAARLSADDAADESSRWQRYEGHQHRSDLNRRFSPSIEPAHVPLSPVPLLGSAHGRGRSTLLRNRLGTSTRESIVTEPDRIHGITLLQLGVVDSDGGEYSSEYKLENLLEQNMATYCSAKSKNIVVVFEHATSSSFVMTHAVMRSPPRGSFTAPVKDALVFVSSKPMNVGDFAAYDDYTSQEYENLLSQKAAANESLDEGEPAAFLSASRAEGDGTVTTKLTVPRTGRFIAVKFLRSINSEHSTNIDCEFIGFKGFSGVRGFADGTLR